MKQVTSSWSIFIQLLFLIVCCIYTEHHTDITATFMESCIHFFVHLQPSYHCIKKRKSCIGLPTFLHKIKKKGSLFCPDCFCERFVLTF